MKYLFLLVFSSITSLVFSMDEVQPISNEIKENISKVTENDFYPILKPGDWVGLQYGAVHNRLIGSEEQPDVVISFGFDSPEQFIFLMKKNDYDFDIERAIENAYLNLENMEVTFTPSNALENKVLTASGNSFSSEAILSQQHMLKAHQLLGAKQLLVSIPRRTTMMVTNRDVSEDILNKFVSIHRYAWSDDSYGHAPIANMLFVLEEGKIIGHISLSE